VILLPTGQKQASINFPKSKLKRLRSLPPFELNWVHMKIPWKMIVFQFFHNLIMP